MRPTGSPTDIPRVEPVGATRLPCQPCLRATVANAAIRGEDLRPAPAAAVPPSGGPTRGAGPSLESDQPSPGTWKKETDASRASSPGQKASQHQPAVLETRTKDPLTDKETPLVIVCLPPHPLTSYERRAAHLPHLEYPLIRVCPRAPRPRT